MEWNVCAEVAVAGRRAALADEWAGDIDVHAPRWWWAGGGERWVLMDRCWLCLEWRVGGVHSVHVLEADDVVDAVDVVDELEPRRISEGRGDTPSVVL